MKELTSEVYDFLYQGPYEGKLFSHPKNYEENPILKNLVKDSDVSSKPKNEKTCDEVFYEYLHTFKKKTNKKYFSLLVKFVLLFIECYVIFIQKDFLIYVMSFMENLWSLIISLGLMSLMKKMK